MTESAYTRARALHLHHSHAYDEDPLRTGCADAAGFAPWRTDADRRSGGARAHPPQVSGSNPAGLETRRPAHEPARTRRRLRAPGGPGGDHAGEHRTGTRWKAGAFPLLQRQATPGL